MLNAQGGADQGVAFILAPRRPPVPVAESPSVAPRATGRETDVALSKILTSTFEYSLGC
jgi:hypothetical protein